MNFNYRGAIFKVAHFPEAKNPLPSSFEMFNPGMDGCSERDAVTPRHRQVQRLPCHPQTPGAGAQAAADSGTGSSHKLVRKPH